MRWFSNILFRLRATFFPNRMEEELEEEMGFHLEMEVRKLVQQGLSPEAARRQAAQNFGEPMRQKEKAREAWGINAIHDLRADARLTFRSFKKSPLFSVVAVLTLALGIGGSTAIFSVVNGVLLKPLPYPEAQELVSVHHGMANIAVDAVPLSPAMYLTFRDHARSFQDIGVWRQQQVTITGISEPERVEAFLVSDGLLPLLRMQPMLGRGHSPEDVAPGSSSPVILSHGYWLRRFGGDPGILGRTLRVEGAESEIIGIMPPDLRLPVGDPEIFLPEIINRTRVGMGNWSYNGIARLLPGITPEEANADLDRLTTVGSEEYGGIPLEELRNRAFTSFVRPLRGSIVGEASTALWVVFGTVGLVLLIACANVANLFLVRAEGRQRDVALRSAIGASRGRIIRQFLTESLLIGLIGGALGLALAEAGVRLLLHLAPPSIPRLEEIGLDPVVLLFALGISLVTGFLFGVIPARRAGGASLAEPLKSGARGSGGGPRRFHLRTLFAVSQVAMALVLLVASGLMVRSFQSLLAVPPGYQDPEEVLTLRVAVPYSEVPDVDEATMAHQDILTQIARLPGVNSASGAASVAMERWQSWDDFEAEDFPISEGEVTPLRRVNWMVPGYFEAMENPLIVGRSIEWADIYERRNVVVVTENFAREYWEEPARALGKRIRNSPGSPWREIVGVVGNIHTMGVAADPPRVLYLPFITANFWGNDNFSFRELRYVIRVSVQEPKTLLPEIRRIVSSVNPNLAIADVRTLDQIFGESIARTSFTLVMLGIAAGVALILGLVGVYGVISYMVAQRTREMGIRIALGATGQRVTRMVLRQGGVVAALGVTVGLGAAVGLTRLMGTLLFGVSAADPLTYASVSAVLVAVVLLASYLPARRAAGVDPTEALRWE